MQVLFYVHLLPTVKYKIYESINNTLSMIHMCMLLFSFGNKELK